MSGPTNGNGKLEALKWILALVLAGLVSYYTTTTTIQVKVKEVETKEDLHFQEVQRSLNRLEEQQRSIGSWIDELLAAGAQRRGEQ